jgi:capsular polysaccharide biosynthesis protein
MSLAGIAAQAEVFQNARIIIGPHGAGLTNMLFAPDDASIIEVILYYLYSEKTFANVNLVNKPPGLFRHLPRGTRAVF